MPRTVHDARVERLQLGNEHLLLIGKTSLLFRRDALGATVGASQRVPALDGARSTAFFERAFLGVAGNGAVLRMVPGDPPSSEPIPGVAGAIAVEAPYILLRDGKLVRLDRRDEKVAPVDLDFAAQAITSTWLGGLCAVTRQTREVRCPRGKGEFLGPFTSTLKGATSLAIGDHLGKKVLCAVLGDGTVRCEAEPGSELSPATNPIARDVSSLRDVQELVFGDAHACARTADGSVYCWGSNADDAIGERPQTIAARPIPVALPPH